MLGNILIGREESGLPKDSVINVSQIVTIDRSLSKTGPWQKCLKMIGR